MEKFVKIMVGVNILIVIGMISGCEDAQQRERHVKSLQVVERDGCEYIVCLNGHGNLYSHKGDCKNPIHNYARKEDEDDQNEVKKNREDRRK
jgi:hypothetical protein